MIKHTITHYYQPTNNSCTQASLAMLFSFFDKTITPEEILKVVPVNKNEKGEDWGSLNQQLATWSISQGFDVSLYTADFQIIDLEWIGLSKNELLDRMELAKDTRDIPSLGKYWSRLYMRSYVDFVRAGGDLHIEPYMKIALIDELLEQSPLLAAVSFNVLHTKGRSSGDELRNSKPDDINGYTANHSVVIYGKDDEGSYLIADPWGPDRITVEPEKLLAAMASAQIECDNLFFQLKKKAD